MPFSDCTKGNSVKPYTPGVYSPLNGPTWNQLQLHVLAWQSLHYSHLEQLRDVGRPGVQDALHADMPQRGDNGSLGALSNQSAHTPLPSCHNILKVDLTWGINGKQNVNYTPVGVLGVFVCMCMGVWGCMCELSVHVWVGEYVCMSVIHNIICSFWEDMLPGLTLTRWSPSQALWYTLCTRCHCIYIHTSVPQVVQEARIYTRQLGAASLAIKIRASDVHDHEANQYAYLHSHYLYETFIWKVQHP